MRGRKRGMERKGKEGVGEGGGARGRRQEQ